ncbi:site-specific DNA-methyltransferase [Xenorhabdus siamensis]|uniref:site-specific DNA-methyltransferase n=1 Tax=Xenorhabdus siamensis TaxID=3136254 RepID=UPI0030F3E151
MSFAQLAINGIPLMTIEKITLNYPESKSADITQKNIDQLKLLFPEIFSEGKIDFDALKTVLGEVVDDSAERFNFTWKGKTRARQITQTPSTGTLRPCKEESVNWDTTENLFIEGDNLEVLKILQKSYHKKVKMIYIDPPYNTGKDFVYKDNFQDNIRNYLSITGQVDSDGHKLSTNSETSGRYHSDWLNMIYPRLKLARNLLREDGNIFISIDDAEIHNLRQICNEVFGEENFIAEMVWQSKSGGSHDERNIVRENEYIIVFAKNKNSVRFGRYEIKNSNYKLQDEFVSERGKYLLNKLDRSMKPSHYSEALNYPIVAPDGSQIWPGGKNKKSPDWNWRWSKKKYHWGIESKFLEIKKGTNGEWAVYSKQYEKVDHNNNVVERNYPYRSVITSSICNTTQGNQDIIKVFGANVFDYTKPVALMEHLIKASGTKDNDIVLDVFSGSATAFCAINNLNEKFGTNIHFIGVQLPEITPEKSVARKNGYKRISDVSKARMKLTEPNQKYGFKVFKLDETNICSWDVNFDNLEPALKLALKSIKDDRSVEDIFYEILLKYGIELTTRVEETAVEGKKIFVVGTGALIVCLDDDITEQVVEGIAKLKEKLNPESTQIVFKDQSFADSVVKTNAIQILKQYGINDVKSI